MWYVLYSRDISLSYCSANTTDMSSELIWHKDVLLKVSVFVWRLLHNRLPTKDSLGRCDVLLDKNSLCVSGCDGVEPVHHLFLKCNIFGSLWYLVHDWVGVSSVDLYSIMDHFNHYAYLSGGPKKRHSFMRLLWLVTIWVIWRDINDMIFSNKVKSMPHILKKVKCLSMWWLEKNVVKCGSSTLFLLFYVLQLNSISVF